MRYLAATQLTQTTRASGSMTHSGESGRRDEAGRGEAKKEHLALVAAAATLSPARCAALCPRRLHVLSVAGWVRVLGSSAAGARDAGHRPAVGQRDAICRWTASCIGLNVERDLLQATVAGDEGGSAEPNKRRRQKRGGRRVGRANMRIPPKLPRTNLAIGQGGADLRLSVDVAAVHKDVGTRMLAGLDGDEAHTLYVVEPLACARCRLRRLHKGKGAVPL